MRLNWGTFIWGILNTAGTRKSGSRKPHASQTMVTSARNCNYILSRMYAGEPTGLKDRDKIRKFDALFQEAERYRREHGEWPGLYNVCRDIVELPAPEYFICHNTAKQMILHERKKRREEIARKWAR